MREERKVWLDRKLRNTVTWIFENASQCEKSINLVNKTVFCRFSVSKVNLR